MINKELQKFLDKIPEESNAKLVRKEIEYVMCIDSEMKITYHGRKFKLKCYADWKGNKAYSISTDEVFGRGMNVSKITSRYISLYTFDMMDQRTTYKMALDRIISGKIIVGEEL